MQRHLHRIGAMLLAIAPLTAQFGNEWVFVGHTNNYSFVNSATGAVVTGSDPRSRNVRGVAFADGGQNLYIANAAPGAATGISRAQWNGTTATWSAFYVVPDASYVLGLDRARQRLWVLTGNATAGRELHCVDANPNSATYGQLLAQTTTLGPTYRERWGLSPSGNLAAVPHGQVGANMFQVVDTNPSSPTFLQVVVSVPLSATSPGSGYHIACAVSRDDRYAYTLTSGGPTPYLAVFDLALQQWLDFEAGPGQQHLTMPSNTPTYMAVAPDASYLVVTGLGGNGWVRRIDIDYQNPVLTTMADVLPGVAKFSPYAPSISFDGSRFAFCAAGGLFVVDAATGAQLQLVVTGAGLFSGWQDLRPTGAFTTYGAGCSGALGAPTLATNPGTPRPLVGATFELDVGNVPFGIALLGTGFSDTTFNGLPLPLPLDGIGMTGCTLLAAPDLLSPVVGAPVATWSLAIPDAPALFGLQLFHQAFALDASANALGITASNAGASLLGV